MCPADDRLFLVFRPIRLAVAMLVLSAAAALGQQTTATVTGQVTDPTGSVVTSAKVVLKNTDTNTTSTTTTGSSGDYLITLLRPGPYTLTVTAPGFQEYSRSGVVLEVNQTMKIDVPLTIGQVTQKTEVSATPS